MKSPEVISFDDLEPHVARKALLCRILQAESALGESDVVITCEVRDGEFGEFVNLMFAEGEIEWITKFCEVRDAANRARQDLSSKHAAGCNAIRQAHTLTIRRERPGAKS